MFWWAQRYLHAEAHQPVALSQKEEAELAAKLEVLEEFAGKGESLPDAPREGNWDQEDRQDSDAYVELSESREIELTERELNALVAKNDPEMAKMVSFDLSHDLVSVRVRVPMDADVPIIKAAFAS